MIESTPAIFDMTLRRFLNKVASNYIEHFTYDTSNDSDCPRLSGSRQIKLVDFRDLLLEPALAKAKGAVCDRRYGDIASMLVILIGDELLVNDLESTEESHVANRMVVRPFTKSQSGVECMLRLEENLISLCLSNFCLLDLDTLHNPIIIMETNNKPTNLVQ